MSSKLENSYKQLVFLSNLIDDIKSEIQNDLESEYVGKYIRPKNKKEQMTTYYSMNNLALPDFESVMRVDYSQYKYLVIDTELESDHMDFEMILKIKQDRRSIWLRIQDVEIVE